MKGAAGDDRAATWRGRGAVFMWAPPEGGDEVEVFHVECGDPDAPALLLVHGWPTCSIDWFELVEPLSERFRVCALDFPGYGFSGKPPGWGYGLGRDAALLDHYLGDVVGAEAAVVLAHDRGTSVAMIHALDAVAGRTRTGVEHLVLTNGNIYLPLSNLTDFQRLLLDPATAPDVLAVITPAMLAEGMGGTTFTPPRSAEHPDVAALAATFAHADGVRVLHETIQYLVERSQHEQEWLAGLATSELPTTVIWGMNDTVAPVRVATHVWSELLMRKPGHNRLYLVPDANHYLQNDRPAAVVEALVHALDGGGSTPGALSPAAASPVLVDCSRASMPAAADVLGARPDSHAAVGS